MLFQAEQRFGVNNFEIDKNLIELGLKRNLSELSKLGLLYRTTWEDGADYRLRRYAGHHKFNILKGDFKFSNQQEGFNYMNGMFINLRLAGQQHMRQNLTFI